MANNERCIRCGYNETDHYMFNITLDGLGNEVLGLDGEPIEEHTYPTCEEFESEVFHRPACPVIDCNGNCRATIRREQERSETVMYPRAQILLGPHYSLIAYD